MNLLWANSKKGISLINIIEEEKNIMDGLKKWNSNSLLAV